MNVRHQASKYSFGQTAQRAEEIGLQDKLVDSLVAVTVIRKCLEKERTLDEILELRKIQEQIATQSKVMDCSFASHKKCFLSFSKCNSL